MRERRIDSEWRDALTQNGKETEIEAAISADEAWMEAQGDDDEGNETDERRAMYAARLQAFRDKLAELAPEYVALEQQKKDEAEKALKVS